MNERDSLVEYGWRRAIITITVVVCALLELIDTTIVNVATTTLAGTLGATFSEISWVIASYAIANVIVVPMSGWLSAQFGRKNYFAGSIILFTIASFMCGQSTNLWMLVFFRFLQGMGGGALLATSQSILVEVYPKEKLGMAMAFFGMGVILGPTIGPLLGGFLIDNFNWPIIFYVNVPIGIIAAFLTLRFIKDNPFQVKQTGRVDWLGIALLIIGVGGIQLVLEQGEKEDWFESTYITTAAIIAVSSVILFIWRQLKVANPIVDLRVMKKGNVAIGVVLSFILGFALYGTVFIIPIYVQRFLGFTATQSGMLFTPGALLTGICMPFVGKLLQKGARPKLLITVGFVLTAIFVFWCSTLITSNTAASDFFGPLLLRGLGMGLLFVPLTNLTLSGLQGKDIASGSGLSSMVRQVGGSFSVALIGVITERVTAQHSADLSANISNYNPISVERINIMTQGMMRFTTDATKAGQQVLTSLQYTIFKQATVLTYVDIFQMLAIFIVCILPLVIFTKSVKGEKVDTSSAH